MRKSMLGESLNKYAQSIPQNLLGMVSGGYEGYLILYVGEFDLSVSMIVSKKKGSD